MADFPKVTKLQQINPQPGMRRFSLIRGILTQIGQSGLGRRINICHKSVIWG